jgi:hypothetical protein
VPGPYHEAFTGPAAAGWVALGVVVVVATAAALAVLRARTSDAGLAGG